MADTFTRVFVDVGVGVGELDIAGVPEGEPTEPGL
jgi:hypothetical protein